MYQQDLLLQIKKKKTILMTNSVNVIQKEIMVKGQKLGTVTVKKYFSSYLEDKHVDLGKEVD